MKKFILSIITIFSFFITTNVNSQDDIQGLIDNAIEGATVIVPSDDYELESTINLNKNITLVCESACNIDASSVTTAIYVTACGADVSGFNIVGGESTTSGITVYNSGEDCDLSNLSTISSNNISGMALPNSNGSPLSYGILVWGDSAESTTNGVTITGNTISNVNGAGISLGDYSSDIEITNNSISDINEVIFLEISFNIGVQSGMSTNGVADNTFSI